MPVEYSDRGFAHDEPIASTYGATVRVYESSAAAGPHIWLSIVGTAHLEPGVQTEDRAGTRTCPGSVAAHLTVEQAKAVRKSLKRLIEIAEGRFDG